MASNIDVRIQTVESHFVVEGEPRSVLSGMTVQASRRRTEMAPRLTWFWAALLIALPALSAEKPFPDWLQGRASDTDPGPSIETEARIDALCQRPGDASEFLRNLNLIWDKKLLTQPAFFHDKELLCLLGGVSVTWKKGPTDAANDSHRSATVALDDNIFPHATIQVQISHLKEAAVPGLPAHVHYVGVLSLNVEGTAGVKWNAVRRVFGPDFRKLSAFDLSPHGSPAPPPGKVFVFYVYPKDDPGKYGAAELPQIRFLLKQGDVAPSQIQRYEPQDSDLIASIFVRQHANRQ